MCKTAFQSQRRRVKVGNSDDESHFHFYVAAERLIKLTGNGKRCSGDDVPDQTAKKPRKQKSYVPALRSGPYALLLGLGTLNEHSSQSMTKAQLVEVAQPYCDASFTVPPDPTKFYTAWNSMKTLVQRELVYEHGRPLRKYALTEEGWEVSKKIQKTLPDDFPAQANNTNATTRPDDTTTPVDTHETIDNDNDDNDDNDPDGTNIHPIPIQPTDFTIQLILDTREVRSSKDRDYISNELGKRGVTAEVRALELGDAMWVAKMHDPRALSPHGEDNDEIVLDWIVERKRLDDLVGSIKDGRFHEQKFRLMRSGVKNVIYLIEDFTVTQDSTAASRQHEMVASAIASTQVVNGYFVKKTRGLDDSIRYLTRMTFLLRDMFSPATGDPKTRLNLLPSRQITSTNAYLSALDRLRSDSGSGSGTDQTKETYDVTSTTFSSLGSKSSTLALRDVYLKMLMCTRGVTGDKALEIQRHWPTPHALVEALRAVPGGKDREGLVAEELRMAVGRRKVGAALSRKIAEVWS